MLCEVFIRRHIATCDFPGGVRGSGPSVTLCPPNASSNCLKQTNLNLGQGGGQDPLSPFWIRPCLIKLLEAKQSESGPIPMDPKHSVSSVLVKAMWLTVSWMLKAGLIHIYIIGFLINVQVQGHHPHLLAPFQVTG